LTDALLAPALAYDAVHRALAALLSGRRVVCFNAAFDARLLAQSAARDGLVPQYVRLDRAMVAYAWYRGEWSRERRDFTWHRLPGAAHGAAAGCRATLDLIQ
jgi:DNA polymerase-3 subunit epsilon